MPNQKGTTVYALQKKFQTVFGFTLPLFHGRGLLNCGYNEFFLLVVSLSSDLVYQITSGCCPIVGGSCLLVSNINQGRIVSGNSHNSSWSPYTCQPVDEPLYGRDHEGAKTVYSGVREVREGSISCATDHTHMLNHFTTPEFGISTRMNSQRPE